MTQPCNSQGCCLSDDSSSVDLPQITGLDNEKNTKSNTVSDKDQLIDIYIPQRIPFSGIPSNGRTLSVALPSSIVDNAQTFELKSYLIGQIARSLTIFGVDEVIIYEDSTKAVNLGCPYDLEPYTGIQAEKLGTKVPKNELCQSEEKNELATCINNSLVEESTNCWSENADKENNQDFLSHDEENEEYNEDDLPENIENFDDRKWSKALYMFVVNLAYLEAPQYLRRILFKMNPLLRMAGLQNPLDAPHHVRADEWISYREGVVISPLTKNSAESTSWVNCGLKTPCRVNGTYPLGSRVTVKLSSSNEAIMRKNISGPFSRHKRQKHHHRKISEELTGMVVDSREPTDKYGLYWGYRVRAARNLSEALFRNPFNNGKYDLIIGTSERGCDFDPLTLNISSSIKHILIVFGPVSGLEECIEDELSGINCSSMESIFDKYINICPNQKSRTIRTEEALMIALANLKPLLLKTL